MKSLQIKFMQNNKKKMPYKFSTPVSSILNFKYFVKYNMFICNKSFHILKKITENSILFLWKDNYIITYLK